MKQFIAELNRRNVSRVAVTYLAAAWFLVEVADTTFPRFGFEDSAVRNVIVLLAIGFIPALVLSWFFELTPEGLTRDLPGETAKSDAPRTSRMADRLIVIMLLGAVGLLAIDKFVLEPTRVAVKIEEATEAGRLESRTASARSRWLHSCVARRPATRNIFRWCRSRCWSCCQRSKSSE